MSDQGSNSSPAGGLNPADLLNLPDKQRRLLIWLARHGPASASTMADQLSMAYEDVREALSQMHQMEYVVCHIQGVEKTYTVRFRTPPKRKSTGLLDKI